LVSRALATRYGAFLNHEFYPHQVSQLSEIKGEFEVEINVVVGLCCGVSVRRWRECIFLLQQVSDQIKNIAIVQLNICLLMIKEISEQPSTC